MRKLISILLIVGLLVSVPMIAFADGPMNRFNQDQKVKIAIFSNATTAAGEQEFKQYVSDSSAGILVPGAHRILGYTLTPYIGSRSNYGYELWFGMYDSNTLSLPNINKLEAEIEITAAMQNTFWLPYPYEIKEGVVLHISPNATLTIYYEDYRR